MRALLLRPLIDVQSMRMQIEQELKQLRAQRSESQLKYSLLGPTGGGPLHGASSSTAAVDETMSVCSLLPEMSLHSNVLWEDDMEGEDEPAAAVETVLGPLRFKENQENEADWGGWYVRASATAARIAWPWAPPPPTPTPLQLSPCTFAAPAQCTPLILD